MYIQFAELPVFDQDRAKRFYTELLGLTVAADAPMGEGGWRWIELALPGARTTLHFNSRPDDVPSQGPVLVLVADAVEGIIEGLRSKGVEIVTEPHETPWAPGGMAAEFRDSEGNRIVLSRR